MDSQGKVRESKGKQGGAKEKQRKARESKGKTDTCCWQAGSAYNMLLTTVCFVDGDDDDDDGDEQRVSNTLFCSRYT